MIGSGERLAKMIAKLGCRNFVCHFKKSQLHLTGKGEPRKNNNQLLKGKVTLHTVQDRAEQAEAGREGK